MPPIAVKYYPKVDIEIIKVDIEIIKVDIEIINVGCYRFFS